MIIIIFIEITTYLFGGLLTFNIVKNWKDNILFKIIFILKCILSLLLSIEVQLLLQLFIMEELDENIPFNNINDHCLATY
jgi:hypothetical protein